MRIALINAPYLSVNGRLAREGYHTFPLGLGYIASILLKEGHNVRLFDPEPYGWSPDDLKLRLHEFDPALVGVGFVTPNFPTAKKILKIARVAAPNCKTVLGGPHVTAIWKSALEETPEADYAVIGEGELTIAELARAIERNELDAISEILGLAHKREGEAVFNGPRPYIADLDALPFPAKHLVDIQKYKSQRYRGRPTTNISASRGCPYNCSFCSCPKIMGNKPRFRSVESVIEEITLLQKKYGIEDLVFSDDTWTLNRKHVESMCEAILQNDIKIGFWAFARANTLLDEDLVKLVKRAGCHTLFIGVESGDPEIMRKMGKGVTIEQFERAFELCQKHRIAANGSFIIGFPEETYESAQNTIDLACRLNPDTALFHRFIPFPGSRYYELLPEEERKDWGKFVMKGAKALTSISPNLSAEEITKLLTKAYLTFYMRPGQLARMARTYSQNQELGQIIVKGRRLLIRLLEWSEVLPVKEGGKW